MIKGTVNAIKNHGKAWNINVDGTWYGFGFEQPDFAQGDEIEFDTIQRGQYTNVDPKSVKKLGSAPAQSSNSGSTGGNGMTKGDYWDRKEEADKDRQRVIQYQASRNAAIETLGVLVSNGLVQVPTKNADKYDFAISMIDQLTAEYNNKVDQFVQFGIPEDNDSAMTSADSSDELE